MLASDLLVVILGLLAGGGLVLGVLGWQREALARRRVGVLERSQAIKRGALAEVARAGWQGDTITVRGALRVDAASAPAVRPPRR